MVRNLDLAALRALTTIADVGGVTRAAGFLNLTQSAVSMQIKRLEEALDLVLLDRSLKQVALTPAGEQLVSYARRMLALNDEALTRLTNDAYEGEIVLGVPHDIVYPAIPRILQIFAAAFPRVNVRLISSYTLALKAQFARGECDMILTTENHTDPEGEVLAEVPLVWAGAPGGTSWRQRPLRIAFEQGCAFRPGAIEALDAAGIPWTVSVESDSSRTIEASVSADLAVTAVLAGCEGPYMEQVALGALPALPVKRINLYISRVFRDRTICAAFTDMIREHYRFEERRRDLPELMAR